VIKTGDKSVAPLMLLLRQRALSLLMMRDQRSATEVAPRCFLRISGRGFNRVLRSFSLTYFVAELVGALDDVPDVVVGGISLGAPSVFSWAAVKSVATSTIVQPAASLWNRK